MKSYEKDVCYLLMQNGYVEKMWVCLNNMYGRSHARIEFLEFIKCQVSRAFADIKANSTNDMFLFYIHLLDSFDYNSMTDFIIDMIGEIV